MAFRSSQPVEDDGFQEYLSEQHKHFRYHHLQDEPLLPQATDQSPSNASEGLSSQTSPTTHYTPLNVDVSCQGNLDDLHENPVQHASPDLDGQGKPTFHALRIEPSDLETRPEPVDDVKVKDGQTVTEDPASSYGLFARGGIGSSAISLLTATLGAGTLVIPYVMQLAGIPFVLIFISMSAAATSYSVYLLTTVVEKTGIATYEELARELVGPRFRVFTAWLIIVFGIGITVVYVIVVQNIMTIFATSPFVASLMSSVGGPIGMTILYWALTMLPLSMVKDVHSLRYGALLGIISTGLLFASILRHSIEFGSIKHIVPLLPTLPNLLAAYPKLLFSFGCQPNCTEIYAHLRTRTVETMVTVTSLSMMMASVIYVAVGIAGKIDFGAQTDPNILSNFGNPMTGPLYLLGSVLAFILTITFAYPMAMLPTRDAMVQLWTDDAAIHRPLENTLQQDDDDRSIGRVKMLVSAVMSIIALSIGILIPNLSIVLGFLGGICISALGFSWPALFVWCAGCCDPSPDRPLALHPFSVGLLGIGGFILGVAGTFEGISK